MTRGNIHVRCIGPAARQKVRGVRQFHHLLNKQKAKIEAANNLCDFLMNRLRTHIKEDQVRKLQAEN